MEDKNGPRERRESYDVEKRGDGKPAGGDQEETSTHCCSVVQVSLLTDVRRIQNTACMRYCWVDG